MENFNLKLNTFVCGFMPQFLAFSSSLDRNIKVCILFGKIYYKLRQGVIANCDKGLLQIATGTLLQIATSFIKNCDDPYYKL